VTLTSRPQQGRDALVICHIEQQIVTLLYSTRAETRKAERQRSLASTWSCESRRPADQTPGRRLFHKRRRSIADPSRTVA